MKLFFYCIIGSIHLSLFTMNHPKSKPKEKIYHLASVHKIEIFCKEHDIAPLFASLYLSCNTYKTAAETTTLINEHCQNYNNNNPTNPILGNTRNELILAMLQENK